MNDGITALPGRHSKPLPGVTRTFIGDDGIVHVTNSSLGLHLHIGDNQPAQQHKLRAWLDDE